MNFDVSKKLIKRLGPVLILALLLNLSLHAAFHLGDAYRAGEVALSSEHHEGQTVYSSSHQCFICQSLQTNPLDKTAEFVPSLQTDETISFHLISSHYSAAVAQSTASRAPPIA
ncbi:MAG TPA: hypothetical protein VEF04_21815 [Blastocatellia bacterium]|nr:hypothetical protein [Blastocatellia bacterium]